MKSNKSVKYLYSTVIGRSLLKLIIMTRADKLLVSFLRSPLSRPIIPIYAKRHNIELSKEQLSSFRTYRDFFVRKRDCSIVDICPGHLISPCDGWLSAYPINEYSSFAIKGSQYSIAELLRDDDLAPHYYGGICLIFRLGASDYHHYCCIDNCYQGKNHFIPGVLHSVQPIACEKFPVYVLNRRSWCLLTTENFGPVVQTEIGALIVGGIYNNYENARILRGNEMGHFELAGSTVVLLFEPGKIRLLPQFENCIKDGGELRVEQGEWIAAANNNEEDYNE